MRCCIIPIAAHRPTRLRRTGTIPLLLQFIDPTGSGIYFLWGSYLVLGTEAPTCL
jgi:hypothetical protein